LLAQNRVVVAFVDVDPDQTGEVLRCEGQLGPVFAPFVVALVGGGRAE
jgi:hypothetical protein